MIFINFLWNFESTNRVFYLNQSKTSDWLCLKCDTSSVTEGEKYHSSNILRISLFKNTLQRKCVLNLILILLQLIAPSSSKPSLDMQNHPLPIPFPPIEPDRIESWETVSVRIFVGQKSEHNRFYHSSGWDINYIPRGKSSHVVDLIIRPRGEETKVSSLALPAIPFVCTGWTRSFKVNLSFSLFFS
ncbi:hypothetical protein TNIN_496601 [Trichonephila inaurata madagascariensis]|uniref:Uncharacterized protein n=1 Tax=Trichonephila inaurata madagascariensis TaxID=2747483 RepID=A0A8X6YF04_9ARAC|nr:hypothetical protein TNIN_496601 [Trichonephila inaurata madagascariensis]